jgi:phage/plasmid-like protein (TIGR03299 family)
MAHNIYDGRMVCVGEAWHKEGVRVDTELTAFDAITKARLNYSVQKVKLFAEVNGQKVEAPFFGTMNMDNSAILGAVTDRYQIVQNVEAFDFFDSVVKSGEAIYHSAGALGLGERIWILAKLPKDILLFKDEIIEQYLLLTNAHNREHSLLMYFTPIRVVCQNTLNASMKDRKNGIALRHIGDMKSKINEARQALGFALDFYKEFDIYAHKMLDTKVSEGQQREYFNRVLDIKDEEKASTRARNIRDTLNHLSVFGKGQEAVKGTLYASYNAVTEYADYYKSFHKGTRTESILFGSSANMKDRAFQEAVVLVK